MVAVNDKVHELNTVDGAQTRFRIYFYDGDCTDDTAVQTSGTLLKYLDTDEDSDSRISGESGVRITEYFNKEEDIEIGHALSSQIDFSLLNFDGGLNSFSYGKCKVYLDIKDTDGTWLPCPMGVYLVDTPAKRKKSTISITAYDCMSKLDAYADTWWYSENLFTDSTTLYSLANSLAEYLGFHLSSKSASAFLNASLEVKTMPFSCSEDTTYRDILEKIAVAAGCNVRFDRGGYLDFCWLNSIGKTIDASTSPTVVMSIDVCEYTTEPINYVKVSDSALSLDTSFVNGDNLYQITDNEFLDTGDVTTMNTLAKPIAERLFAVSGISPMVLSLIGDYTVQAGDIVSVIYGDDTYSVPIYCNEMQIGNSWALCEYSNSGNVTRPTGTKESRATARNTAYVEKVIHTMTNNIDELTSKYDSTDGRFTELSQTINGISATINDGESGLSTKLSASEFNLQFSSLKDDVGENKEAISKNTEAVESKVSQEEFSKYIRFVGGTIILGNTESEIKLRIKNDTLYFFNGEDDESSPTILAYFSNNEMYVANINSENHLQIGTDSSGVNYQFVKDDDGDLLLRMV